MATGIVLSIDPSGVSGQVQVDETGETLAFNDANFPNTGLTATAPKNACTFDIVVAQSAGDNDYATNLMVATASNPQTYNTSYTGDLAAPVGHTIIITGPGTIVTGNITISGGKVVIENGAQVNGNINANSDGIVAIKGKGTVRGNVVISSGGNMKVVNKGKIMGGVSISQGGRMMLGNDNGPGSVTGAISIQRIRNLSITVDSSINCG